MTDAIFNGRFKSELRLKTSCATHQHSVVLDGDRLTWVLDLGSGYEHC